MSSRDSAPKQTEQSDQIWQGTYVAETPKSAQPYKQAMYKSLYLTARDGVRLAIDVLVPKPDTATRGAVLYQTRYMRAIQLRWPLDRFVAGRGVDLVSFEHKCSFLAAGFAVVSMDIRGTGASFGQFCLPWAVEHRQDACEVLDWICAQSWSNKQVVLAGVSYEATAALVTVAQQHRAVKGTLAMFPFWDLFMDINLPGGIQQHKFIAEWSRFCRAMDANDFRLLPWTTRLFLQLVSRGCQPVMGGLDGTTDSEDSKKARVNQKAAELRLEQAVAEHRSWDATSASMQRIRFADDVDDASGLTLSQGSPVAVAKQIAQAHVPLLLVAGWLDSTASPAILCFLNNRAAGTQLCIGPWAHGGFLNNDQPGPKMSKLQTRFSSKQLALQFLHDLPGFQPGPCSDNSDHTEASSKQPSKVIPHAQASATNGHGNVEQRCADVETISPEQCSGLTTSQNGTLPEHAAAAPESSSGCTHAAERQAGESSAARQPDASRAPGSSPVHFFIMGHEGHWQAANSWPPPLAEQPLQLFLGMAANGSSGEPLAQDHGLVTHNEASAQHGVLLSQRQEQACRWEHHVSAKKHLKGFSRYQAMTKLTSPIAYKGFSRSGHVIFTGRPLQTAVTVIGSPAVDLWVESSDSDADVFVYLLDYDPEQRTSRYVTEGMLRASHRHQLPQAPAEHERAASTMPGQPFRSFARCHAQPLQPASPVQLRFPLMPTAFRFAPGHCIRLTASGADAKHYTMDQSPQQPRIIWLHGGPEHTSCVTFEIAA